MSTDRARLAEYLRTRRAALQPEDVGLPRGRRRRTDGLRREEVAVLSDMSIDYYSRLEQPRGPHPSEQILGALPKGSLKAAIGKGKACEGLGIAEAFRGDVLVWLRLDGKGRVARCHLRDASWFQWPLLEAAIEANIVADFPLCNKSFNCSYSGHDL